MHQKVLLLSLLCLAATLANVCQNIASTDGNIYDLTEIIGQTLKLNDGFSDFNLAVCANPFKCGIAGKDGAAYCQVNDFFSDCIGIFTDTPTSVVATRGSVTISYGNGDWGLSGLLTLKCNPLAENFTKVEPTQFYKHIIAESKHGCPKYPIVCTGKPCRSCTKEPMCKFCLNENTCMQDSGQCSSWTKTPEFCPPDSCATHVTCTSCAKSACSWCVGEFSKCTSVGNTPDNCRAVVRDPDFCNGDLNTF